MIFADLRITADDVAAFHAADPSAQWWWHADHGLAIVTDTPLPEGALYLMPWDAAWFAQWNENWQGAADVLNDRIQSITRLQEE